MAHFHYHIRKMDCPSEEALIRQQLAGLPVQLHFDLAARELHVYGEVEEAHLSARLAALDLGCELLSADAHGAAPVPAADAASERRILIAVLVINAVFFVAETLFGWLSGSMGLIGDGLDMLADSLVYALSLIAVGATLVVKRRVARIAGWLQATLAVIGLLEVLRRVFGQAEAPDVSTMIILSLLALAGNALCLVLLQRHRHGEAHIQASMIFTANDVLINLGVIASALAVWLSGSRWPDLAIGSFIFVLVLYGARRILQLAKAPAP